MAIKYIHARLPGRELIHLVPAADLIYDDRFGEETEFVTGYAETLCGKAGTGWLVGTGKGDPCRSCAEKRHAA